LIAAGYDEAIDGEAYETVAYQNANNSVGVTDRFMRAVEQGEWWKTSYRTRSGGPEYQAQDLLHEIAQAAWECGDPGLFYTDNVNSWHTTPSRGPIRSGNPCVPGFTPILTRYGYRTIEDTVSQEVDIWNGSQWSTVCPFSTGYNPTVTISFSDGTSLRCT